MLSVAERQERAKEQRERETTDFYRKMAKQLKKERHSTTNNNKRE